MSANLNDLIPEMQPFARELVNAAGAAGYMPRVTSTLRTRAQQTRLYRDYLRGGRGFPVAPPGQSAHEFGYALDMVLAPMEALWDAGQFWKKLGGVWGPGDAIHFEFPGFHEDLAAGLIRPLDMPPAALTAAADIVSGSALASLAEAVGLASPLTEALASPVETLQPYVHEVAQKLRDLGVLY